jgi:hypothetical protein
MMFPSWMLVCCQHREDQAATNHRRGWTFMIHAPPVMYVGVPPEGEMIATEDSG